MKHVTEPVLPVRYFCFCVVVAVLTPVLFALPQTTQCGDAVVQSDPLADFREELQKLAAHEADPCGTSIDIGEEVTKSERSLFDQASRIIVQKLNAPHAVPKAAHERATEALKPLEVMSSEINAGWPGANRFHFQVFDIQPILVVKMSIRTHDRFFVFGIHDESRQDWQQVGSDHESLESPIFGKSLDIYPLHRGPSGNARFLAAFRYVGCAGMSMGIAYDASEWDKKNGTLDSLIEQEGASGIDEEPKEFAETGVLRTKGPLITLPYCWFSAIDTWDNPSLCAVDTYDLSGDDVRFRYRRYNRPDLVPVAKAIEYAEKKDYPAVRAYCASDKVAHRLVQEIPPHAEAILQTKRKAEGKERIEMGGAYFDVEKHGGRWLVVAFNAE